MKGPLLGGARKALHAEVMHGAVVERRSGASIEGARSALRRHLLAVAVVAGVDAPKVPLVAGRRGAISAVSVHYGSNLLSFLSDQSPRRVHRYTAVDALALHRGR